MSDDELTRVHLSIIGGVQGVFFRATTRDEAQARDLTGWVRNTDDGQVEAEVQGSSAAVDALIEECRTGPPHARVKDLDVDPIDVVAGESGFEVR